MERLSTMLVHAGRRSIEGAVVPPVFHSANYLNNDAGDYGGVTYLRLSNTPQLVALGEKLAAIEGAERALPLASGMAAVSTALLSVLSAGDHLLVQRNVYGGTATFLRDDLARLGVTATEIDATDPAGWAAAVTPRTRAVYVEAVSNPLLEVPELDAVVAFARERGLVSLIDNTFQSPVGFRPVPFGFDLVVHSATKYLNGHSDLVAGVVAGSAARLERVAHVSHHLGGSLDPHAAFLLDRGLKTLELRLARQTATAARLATFLAGHPAVARVRWPGLPGDPGHERARRFYRHFGAMITFDVRTDAAADALLGRLRLALHAASLGGVETLVVRPSRSSHLGLSPGERELLGITDRMIRLSVGIEDAEDLVEDFGQALG